jgi:choline dehydrogenase-like flavoprotein
MTKSNSILSKLNIPVRVSNPAVGENLQDQINNGLTYSGTAKTAYTGQRGYAVYPNATDIFGSSTSSVASSVQAAISSHASAVAAQSNNATKVSDLVTEFTSQYNLMFSSQVPIAEIIFYPSGTSLASQYWGLLPFARGNVHINSTNPLAQPVINPNYWMLGWDSEAQVGIAKFIRKLFATAPLNSLVTKESYPGTTTVPSGASNTVWANWLKSQYRPNYHVVGTTAMKPQANGGVVSNRLVVYGTTNVRVVDASVWPTQVCGHLMSTLYAVAERASDMIKQDNQ